MFMVSPDSMSAELILEINNAVWPAAVMYSINSRQNSVRKASLCSKDTEVARD
jgi:hypothetical protein